MEKKIHGSKHRVSKKTEGSVPAVWKNVKLTSDRVAVLCSDLHLSHRPPSARTDDWYQAMDNYLSQLRGICGASPCIIAGDIFDRWNAPAELINFLIKQFPPITFAIPGQHDLPYHSLSDIRKSAYWTLVEAGTIRHLYPGLPIELSKTRLSLDAPEEQINIRLHGFPFGIPIKPLENPHDLLIEIAVCHSYIWIDDNTRFDGASDEQHTSHYMSKLRGYDVVVFGDNHIPFHVAPIYNCGGFMRRNLDQINHTPGVGILRRNGVVDKCFLDTGRDRFVDAADAAVVAKDHDAFIKAMGDIITCGLNFREHLERLLNKDMPKETRQVILDALENEQ